MVVALQCFTTLRGHHGPSRMPGTHGSSEMACLSHLSTSSCAPPPFGPPRTWGSAVAPALSPSAQPFFRRSGLRSLRPSLERRCPLHLTFATPQEDSVSSISSLCCRLPPKVDFRLFYLEPYCSSLEAYGEVDHMAIPMDRLVVGVSGNPNLIMLFFRVAGQIVFSFPWHVLVTSMIVIITSQRILGE